MTPIAEVRLPVNLDRQREIIMNANTMRFYEQESAKSGAGKSYWETMLDLMRFYDDCGEEMVAVGTYEKSEDRKITQRRLQLYTSVMRYINTTELLAMIWAALHQYDAQDEPFWDLTPSKLGRMIKPIDTIGLVSAIIRGHNGNAPTAKELGEVSGGDEKVVEVLPAETKTPRPQLVNGGAASIALPADAFS